MNDFNLLSASKQVTGAAARKVFRICHRGAILNGRKAPGSARERTFEDNMTHRHMGYDERNIRPKLSNRHRREMTWRLKWE